MIEYSREAEEYIFQKFGWESVIRCRVVWSFHKVLKEDFDLSKEAIRVIIGRANESHDKEFPGSGQKLGERS